MRSSRTIHTVSVHAEGEVGDVIVGGVSPPPGDTLWAQSRWIAQDNVLRNFMLNEPRGGVFRHVNLLVPPKDPRADMGFIIMEPVHTPPMSGSNSICVATAILETGILPIKEPETALTLEAPGGLVAVIAECEDGRVKRIKITNVPSFADKIDAALEVPGYGTVVVDTAYGGDSFVLVDGSSLGFRIVPDEARDLAEAGVVISKAATEQLGFHHPDKPDWAHISFCQFTHPVEIRDGQRYGLNTVTIEPGKLDRSPTGTGVSARMAVLQAKNQMQVGDTLHGISIIGSEFSGRIEALTEVAGKPAIVPSISGRAWITGTHQHMLDPDDPWPEGYRVGDTWPSQFS